MYFVLITLPLDLGTVVTIAPSQALGDTVSAQGRAEQRKQFSLTWSLPLPDAVLA
jgi:hypothetical protein